MSQIPAPPPPAPPAPAPAAPAPGPAVPPTPAAPRPTDRLRAAFAGTPGALRLAGLVAAAVAVLFGVLGSSAVAARSDAIERARDEGAQIVRLQEVRTNLVAADAAATNAFLVGGLEPSDTREAYEEGIDAASTTLALAAAESTGDDDVALAEVNRAVARYSGLVESARANNRQGLPVGVAYLKQASSLLRDEVLPTLEAVTEATGDRVDAGYDRSARALRLMVLGPVAAIVGMLFAQAVLFTNTRRLISVPLASALGVVLGATILASAGMAFAQWKANDVRSGPYAAAVALSQARIDAFDAKAAESLTLISRGSGQAFEDRFQDKAATAVAALEEGPDDSAAGPALAAYLEVHRGVRELDDGGSWEGAVALATDSLDRAGSNATFAAFDEASGDELAAAADAQSDDLRAARTPLGALRLLVLAAGIAAAALAWQGAAVRLREYR